MRRALVLALACGGCDVLFKLDTVPLHADGAPPIDDGISEGSDTPNLAFVSSQQIVPGMLGSVTAADATCESLAAAAGHPGRYVAWLSSATSAAPSRIGTGARGWVRSDGRPFADTLVNIVQGRVWYPLRLTEAGDDVTTSGLDSDLRVVTGTNADGSPSLDDCLDYTAADAMHAATAGLADNAPFGWTSFMGTICNDPARLYCFQTDHDAPVTLVPETTRHAFVTDSGIAANAGIAQFDAFCRSQASDYHLSGTFAAAIATTTAPALSRFPAGGPWARVDGVTATDATGTIIAPLELDAGAGMEGATVTWNGAHALTAMAPNAAASCSNWTVADTTMGLTGNDTRSGFYAFGGLPNTCNNVLPVYCLEQ